MSEADEVAQSLIAKHGNPNAKSHSEARAWLSTIWPDAAEWLGTQMLDNVADSIVASAEAS